MSRLLLQFMKLGIYEETEDEPPYEIRYLLVIDGEIRHKFKKLNTAIIELAAAIDEKIGVSL